MSASGPVKQKQNFHYDRRFIGQQPSVLPFDPTQQYYQTPFYSTREYPPISYNQLAQYGRNPTLLMHSKQLDKQYQYQQKWNYMNEMQKTYRKQQVDTMALSMYARPFPINYTTGTIYPVEKKTQFMNRLDLDGLGVPRFSGRRVVGYSHPSNLGYSGWLNNNVINFGNDRRLPPKIRTIFVPLGFVPLQQLCAGPLDIPPFLFSRMLQPLYSLPLPPPLPQMASFYLENDVQQMLMQRYANPVAVLPFIPNWQMSSPMMASYPQIYQQQQQSIMPRSTFDSYQPALMPSNMPIFSSQIPSAPDTVGQASQIPHYHNSGYPSLCYICIPALPTYHNSIASNSGMQYRSTSHHIPAPNTNPNVRPINERSTLLLGRATVQQNVDNQSRQQYQYPHTNEFTSMNSWLRKTPPLPPSAVIVFDKYVDKNDLSPRHRHSKKHQNQPPRIKKPVQRSITINTNSTNRYKPSKHSVLSEVTKTKSDVGSRRSFGNPKSVASTRSVYSLSWNDNINREKTITSSTDSNEEVTHEQLPAEASHVNLRAVDQPHILPDAHDADQHLKSNDQKLNSSSNPDVLRDLRLSLAVGGNQTDQIPTVPGNPMNEEEEEEQSENKTNKSIHAPSSIPSQSKRSNTEISIIRENIRQTPSIITTNSRNTLNTLKDKNFDSVSIISVSKTDKQSERNLSTIEAD